MQLDGVVADRLDARYLPLLLPVCNTSGPGHGHAFCRGRVDAQEFARQPELLAIREDNLQHTRFLVQLDLGGERNTFVALPCTPPGGTY